MTETHESLREHFRPLSAVVVQPPRWIIPKLIPPGLTLLVGDPKTYKSLLCLHMAAAVTELEPVGPAKEGRCPERKGTVAYFAAEQSEGRLREIYETRVIRRSVGAVANWNFILAKDPWGWKLDDPEAVARTGGLEAFVREVRPTLTIIDPLVYFHSMDENDPRLVQPLAPLRQAVLKFGGALVIVHHARKSPGIAGRPTSNAPTDWNRVRGTSALWAMADAGIMATRLAGPIGGVNLQADFKDWPSITWTWRP